MSLSLAIALNVALDVALLSGLALSMWQPRKLRPHAPTAIVERAAHEADMLLAELPVRRG